MKSAISLIVVAQLAHTSHAAICQQPQIRREWRNLTQTEQLNYIDAIKCLRTKPAQTSDTHAGAKSRYDDFHAVHIDQADYIHWTAQFLPWHRYMLSLWESSLVQECGYTGVIPYWNWALDAGTEESMVHSPVFDTISGFGGNGAYIADISGFPPESQPPLTVPGRTGGDCVSDGPFANLIVNMGPGNNTSYSPHCLRRDFSPWVFHQGGNQANLDWTLTAKDFGQLDYYLQGNMSEGAPGLKAHGAGHLGVGGQIGEMSDTYSSPGDPLFYLHHGGIDRIWWTWQRADWPARNFSIGGPDTQFGYPYGDIPYKNITLDTPLYFGQLADTIEVSSMMDTEGGFLCYTYE